VYARAAMCQAPAFCGNPQNWRHSNRSGVSKLPGGRPPNAACEPVTFPRRPPRGPACMRQPKLNNTRMASVKPPCSRYRIPMLIICKCLQRTAEISHTIGQLSSTRIDCSHAPAARRVPPVASPRPHLCMRGKIGGIKGILVDRRIGVARRPPPNAACEPVTVPRRPPPGPACMNHRLMNDT